MKKVSPKNDNVNKQKFQVLKHFLCFGKKTFKYRVANFSKKQLILDLSRNKQLKK